MTQRVVDEFESIQIHEHTAVPESRMALAMLSAKSSARTSGSAARQGVMQGAIRHLSFRCLRALMSRDDHRTGQSAVGFENGRTFSRTGTWLPLLRRKTASSKRGGLSQVDQRKNLACGIGGDEQRGNGQGQGFGGRVAQKLLGAVVPGDYGAGGVGC